jgi:hypothetical protein
MSDYPRSDEEKIFEAYKLMIRARDFHHESYTKWMNFFYIAEAAVLLAYTNSHDNSPMLSLLGFLFSLLGYLSCRGHYFWTHNWIDQLYRLERNFDKELRVYSTFSLNTKKESKILRPLEPANLSTSKLTLTFFLLIFFLWTILLTHNFLKAIHCDLKGPQIYFWMVCTVISILLLIASLVIINTKRCRKHLETHWLNSEVERDIECRNIIEKV